MRRAYRRIYGRGLRGVAQLHNLDQRKRKKEVKGSPELRQAGTSMDVARCMGTHSVTQTSGNCVTGWRRRRFFVPRQRFDCCCRTLVRSVRAESILFGVYGKALELSALGKRSDTIARASRFLRSCNLEMRAPHGSRKRTLTRLKCSGRCTSSWRWEELRTFTA